MQAELTKPQVCRTLQIHASAGRVLVYLRLQYKACRSARPWKLAVPNYVIFRDKSLEIPSCIVSAACIWRYQHQVQRITISRNSHCRYTSKPRITRKAADASYNQKMLLIYPCICASFRGKCFLCPGTRASINRHQHSEHVAAALYRHHDCLWGATTHTGSSCAHKNCALLHNLTTSQCCSTN